MIGGSTEKNLLFKFSVDRWTSVVLKIELGKYSSIHVKRIQHIEKSVDPQKKNLLFKFSVDRWTSVDQKIELGEYS